MKSALASAIINNGHNPGSYFGNREDEGHKYETIPQIENEEGGTRASVDWDPDSLGLEQHLEAFKKKNRRRLRVTAMGAVGVFIFFFLAIV